jgi:hypothetical protein
VEASRKAVDAYRRLVHGSPVHYETGLAASLHDLSLRLSEAGDTAGARAAIEEAIVIRRRWARYGARYAEGLAQSLALLTQHRDRRAWEPEDSERYALRQPTCATRKHSNRAVLTVEAEKPTAAQIARAPGISA